VGSIFIAPAYLYGHYKTGISDAAFVVFVVSEIVVLLSLFVIAKIWMQFLPDGVRQIIETRPNSGEREQ
jgi:hypothetical protein